MSESRRKSDVLKGLETAIRFKKYQKYVLEDRCLNPKFIERQEQMKQDKKEKKRKRGMMKFSSFGGNKSSKFGHRLTGILQNLNEVNSSFKKLDAHNFEEIVSFESENTASAYDSPKRTFKVPNSIGRKGSIGKSSDFFQISEDNEACSSKSSTPSSKNIIRLRSVVPKSTQDGDSSSKKKLFVGKLEKKNIIVKKFETSSRIIEGIKKHKIGYKKKTHTFNKTSTNVWMKHINNNGESHSFTSSKTIVDIPSSKLRLPTFTFTSSPSPCNKSQLLKILEYLGQQKSVKIQSHILKPYQNLPEIQTILTVIKKLQEELMKMNLPSSSNEKGEVHDNCINELSYQLKTQISNTILKLQLGSKEQSSDVQDFTDNSFNFNKAFTDAVAKNPSFPAHTQNNLRLSLHTYRRRGKSKKNMINDLQKLYIANGMTPSSKMLRQSIDSGRHQLPRLAPILSRNRGSIEHRKRFISL